MRTNEFIFFTFIFTIGYILFFFIFDRISYKIQKNKERKNALNLISMETYLVFAGFYGLQGKTSIDNIHNIYRDLKDFSDSLNISKEALKYSLDAYEYIVIILYLEYLNVIQRKCIIVERDIITKPTDTDSCLLSKYYTYLHDRKDVNGFVNFFGNNAINDLYYLNSKFLIPGIRFINNTLYYVGDFNEKK